MFLVIRKALDYGRTLDSKINAVKIGRICRFDVSITVGLFLFIIIRYNIRQHTKNEVANKYKFMGLVACYIKLEYSQINFFT